MAEKGTRHRFELSRLELAGVAVSTAAGFFVVFLLGIYAGRGMVEQGEQVVRLPVPPASDEAAPPPSDLTFYDELGGQGERLGGPAERAGAAPPPEPAAERHLPPPPVAGPKEIPPAVAEHVEPEAPSPAIVARVEAPPPPPSPAASPAARLAVAIAKPETEIPPNTGGEWSVQVSATRDPRTAQGIMKKLKERGYTAYVRETKRQGATFYRVRVGHYASLEEANKVVSRLRKEPGVPEAFVASD